MHNRKQSLQDGKGNTATSFSKSYRAWCVQQGRGVTSSFLDCHACSQLARLLGFVKHRWGYIRIGTLKTRVSEVGKKQFCYLALVLKATWSATPELSLETILRILLLVVSGSWLLCKQNGRCAHSHSSFFFSSWMVLYRSRGGGWNSNHTTIVRNKWHNKRYNILNSTTKLSNSHPWRHSQLPDPWATWLSSTAGPALSWV